MMVDVSDTDNDKSKNVVNPMPTSESDQHKSEARSTGAVHSGGVNPPIETIHDRPARDDQSLNQKASVADKTARMEIPGLSDASNPRDIPASSKSVDEAELPWFNKDEADELHSRWSSIQFQFVDQPCASVEQGEALLAETVERIKQMLSDRQKTLGARWLNKDDITTEELRLTLRNYRSFLNHLLSL